MTSFDLDAWYRAYGEAVFRRCRRFVRSDAAAMDLVQDTFLRAHKYRSSYRGGSPLSWLLTIADRASLDVVGRTHEAVSLDEVEAFLADESGERAGAAGHRDLVRRLLARADERTARIVISRYFDELGLEEIAGALGVNERTVRRTLEAFLADARRQCEARPGGTGAVSTSSTSSTSSSAGPRHKEDIHA